MGAAHPPRAKERACSSVSESPHGGFEILCGQVSSSGQSASGNVQSAVWSHAQNSRGLLPVSLTMLLPRTYVS